MGWRGSRSRIVVGGVRVEDGDEGKIVVSVGTCEVVVGEVGWRWLLGEIVGCGFVDLRISDGCVLQVVVGGHV